MTRKIQEDENENLYVHRRADDRSFWLRVSYMLDKYRLLVYIGFFVLVALGFDFKTPKQAFTEVKAEIDTVNLRVDAIEKEHLSVKNDLRILLKLRCLDSTYSDRQLALAGLNCVQMGVVR